MDMDSIPGGGDDRVPSPAMTDNDRYVADYTRDNSGYVCVEGGGGVCGKLGLRTDHDQIRWRGDGSGQAQRQDFGGDDQERDSNGGLTGLGASDE